MGAPRHAHRRGTVHLIAPDGAHALGYFLNAHLNVPPPRPSSVRAEVPRRMDAVIARGMAKDPADRYPTAGDLAAAAFAAAEAPRAPSRAAEPGGQRARTGSSAGPMATTMTGPRSPAGPRASTAGAVPVPTGARWPRSSRNAAAGVLPGVWGSQQYYVGADAGQVVIVDGVRGSVLGIGLQSVAERTA